MIIQLIGEVKDQPDGSGTVELDLDEEGKQYLIQLGFQVLILRGIDAMKQDKEMYGRDR